MKKDELIYNFVHNMYISSTKDLVGSNLRAYYIDGTDTRVLKNYNTIIAMVDCKKDYCKVILNSDKYSQTTSRNQNLIRAYASDIEEVSENEIYKMLREV